MRPTRSPDTAPDATPRVWLLLPPLLALALKLWGLARLLASPLADLREADAEAYWRWSGLLVEQRWRADDAFFLGPLYPYAVAAVRAVAGHSAAVVLALQCVAGAVGVGLLTLAARRLAGTRVAVATGVLLALNPAWTFFDLLVLSESLQLALGSALLALLVLWRWDERARSGALLAGACIGLLALARPSSVLLALPVLALLAARHGVRRALPPALALAAVVAAFAAPTVWHHARGSREFVPWTYSGGFNLFVGHGPFATGTWSMPGRRRVDFADAEARHPSRAGDYAEAVTRALGREPSPREHSAYFADLALSTARAHPLRALSLTARKLFFVFHHRDLPQIESREAYERILGPLGAPVLGSFALLAVAGLAGFALAWRRPGTRAVALVALVHVVVMAAFFVTDRYRVHLVPPLALGTASTLGALGGFARRRGQGAWRCAAGAAVGAVLAFTPVFPYDARRTAWDAAVTHGDAWLRAGQPARALAAYDEAVALDRAHRAPGAETTVGREIRASLYATRAIAHVRLNQLDAAADELETAIALDPADAELALWLADLHVLGGRHDAATRALELSRLPRERWAARYAELALTRERDGQRAEAEAFRRGANAFSPSAPPR